MSGSLLSPFCCFWSVPIAFVLIAAIGCGSAENTAQVSGAISINGTPLTEGTVTFEMNGRAFSGEITDGKYELTHDGGTWIPPGEYVATVNPPPPKTRVNEQTTEIETVSAADPALYPMKYRRPDKSGLKYDVAQGVNTIDIDLP